MHLSVTETLKSLMGLPNLSVIPFCILAKIPSATPC